MHTLVKPPPSIRNKTSTELICKTPTSGLTFRHTRPVTEKPREVAGERLLRRLSTTSYGKVASRFLIDVPIGNTKNAKALQVNKL
jgi:hypothetical protein